MSNFKIDWIFVNELAIGRAPQKKHHFESIREKGINSILSLCFQDEYKFDRKYIQSFHYYNYPLPDHRKNKLPKPEEIFGALEKLNLLLNEGPVFVHCYAAVERSPLVCMAWLMHTKKLSLSDSLDYMMEVHPGTCPLTSQLKILEKTLLINDKY